VLEEDLDQIGALMSDFLDRKVSKNIMLDGNLGVRQARGRSR